MRNLNFKKIKASNFLCFGEKGIELDFNDLKNIVLIKGINHDVVGEGGKFSSNGSGKSSIPECIVYALYGKTIKSPKKISHKDVINNKSGKKLSVELCFDDYKIVRTRKPDSLRVWKSDANVFDESTEITLGGMPTTQELIENIIGLSYESFLNVCVFTDDNGSSFLELEPNDKRKIIENLLNLEKYRNYLETVKILLKESKDFLKTTAIELSLVESNKLTAENNVASIKKNIQIYKDNLKLEIEKIKNQIDFLKNQIQDSSYEEELEKYNEAQLKLEKINNSIKELSKKKDEVSEVYKKLITDVQEKMNEKLKKESECNQIVQECKNVESNISLIQNKIDKFKNIKPNMVCDKCYGTIKPENYKDVLRESESEKVLLLEYLEKKIKEKDELKIVLIERTKKLDDVNVSVEKVEGFNKKIYNQEKIYSESISELRKIKRPEQSNNDLVITEKIKTLSETLAEKENLNSQDSPHQDLLDSNLENLQSLKDKFNLIKEKIKAAEEKAPYYDFWTEAFGDNGIRKIVVDEIIPALNSRLEYWLQVLIDNKLEIKFDDSLNETIVKYPNNDKQLIYSVLSNGQKRRINLAVNQAFAHMMMLSHGISPNIIFLDEVTTNIDQIGVQGIYNMICELSKEKKVFVTTHDSDLLSLLYGCETISLEMKNGETKIL
jgi:DNA repair exonuclease SbcCD ATPase subunit